MIAKASLFLAFLLATVAFAAAGFAAETVKVGGADARLEVPSDPKASLILVPGRGGLSDRDPLQRASERYVERGFAVLSVDKKTKIGAAIKYMAGVAKPVAVAAVSAGTRRVAQAIAKGRFRSERLVLVSGDLKQVREKIGQARRLPTTLVIHHRNDACDKTSPGQVAAFQSWGGDKVTVRWMEGGRNAGDPCGPGAYHGLAGLDDQVVAAIADFIE